MQKWFRYFKDPNVEARIIGLQNGQPRSVLDSVSIFLRGNHMRLCEIDLFGDQTRHVCFDTKTGASFDVLVNNKLYTPGELMNRMTMEQFEKSTMGRRPTA